MEIDLTGDDVSPHRVSLVASSPEALSQGMPGLLRMVEKLCADDVDPKHRRLRLSNASLNERVLRPLPGALDILQFLGYSPIVEMDDTWLCLDTSRWNPTLAREEMKWLQEMIDSRWKGQPWSCPACTLFNSVDAVSCSVCGSKRPAWASPPTDPKPRLVVATTKPSPRSQAEHAQRAETLRRAKDEKQMERERILAEAKADRERFQSEENTAPAVAAVSSGSTTSPHVSGSGAITTSSLRIRLSTGEVVEETFQASDQLLNVFKGLDNVLRARGESCGDYALLQSIPRRVFIREVLGSQSLRELELIPSATLSILRAEDRGRVQSGGVERALLTGDISGLSYNEMLELEAIMGDVQKSKRHASNRKKDLITNVWIYSSGAGLKSKRTASAEKLDVRCSICLMDFEDGDNLRELWCQHSFHLACIDQWLAEHDECPVCRMVPT